ADSDGIIDNALALDKLPKPVRDDYDFVCWYLEKYESEDLSGLLSVNKITEETDTADLLARQDLVPSKENGIEIHAVWTPSEEMVSGDGVMGPSKVASGDGVMGSSESSEDSSDDASEVTSGDGVMGSSESSDDASDDASGEESEDIEPEEISGDEAGLGSEEEELSEDQKTPILVTELNRNGFWIYGLPEESVVYTGAPIEFKDPDTKASLLKVYNGAASEENLVDPGNYTVSYKNNKNVGTATVTVTFKNNYSGKISDTFNIVKANFETTGAGYSFAYDEVVLPYNGKFQKGVPVITYTSSAGVVHKLKNGTDFTVEYPDYSSEEYKGTPDYSEYPFIGTPDGTKEDNTFNIVVKGKGSFDGTLKIPEYIMPSGLVSMSKATVKVTAAFDPATISAYGIEDPVPVVTVTYNKKNLRGVLLPEYDLLTEDEKEEIDFTYDYENGIYSGYESLTGTMTLTGTGNHGTFDDVAFYGSTAVSYKLTNGIPISKAKFELRTYEDYRGSISYEYMCENGYNADLRGMNLTYGDLKLLEGTHYTVSYKPNIYDAGTVTATYKGLNGFTGSVNKTFKISPVNIESVKLTLVQAPGYDKNTYPYAKGGVKPEVEGLTFTYIGEDGMRATYMLVPGKDYTVSYSNNTTVGNTAKLPTITVKGKGNFTGTKSKTFKIVGQDFSAADTGLIVNAANKVYAKKAGNYTTTVSITEVDGKKLVAGTDYEKNFRYEYAGESAIELPDGTVRYPGNIVQDTDIVPVGTIIKVTAFGKGNYKGEISGTYRIIAADISKASVKIPTQYYEGKACEPSYEQIEVKLSGTILSSEDYVITGYANNNGKGKGSLTITGIGDYGGTKTVPFTIAVKTVNEKCTVVFNGNGATSGSMGNLSIAKGKSATLPAIKYKRNGYYYDNEDTWNTAPDGSGTDYALNERIDNTDDLHGRTLVLYVKWKPIEYSITTHYGGWVKSDGFEIKSKYAPSDASYTIPVPGKEHWPAGYQFGGWYKDSAFKTRIAVIKKGSTGNIDLYAKWIPYTFMVSFDGNGATGGEMMTQTFSFGVGKSLNPNTYKKDGVQFAGWALGADHALTGKVDFTDKEIITEDSIEDKDDGGIVSFNYNFNTGQMTTVPLYAVWSNSFSISYLADGGTLADDAEVSYEFGVGVAKLPVATKDGYSFGGWFRDSTLKKQVKSISKKDSGNKVFYAKWTPNKYTIAFNGNKSNSGKTASQTVYYNGGQYKLNSNGFIKTDSVFAGWSLSSGEDAVKVYDNGGSFTTEDLLTLAGMDPKDGSRTITLYAMWNDWTYGKDEEAIAKRGTKYTVIFDSNKPSTPENALAPSGKMKNLSMTYGTSKALTKNAYKIKGYSFVGWSKESNTEPDSNSIIPDMAPISDLGNYNEVTTLYAIWKMDEYSVTYMNTEGADNTESITKYNVYDTLDDKIMLREPTRMGDVFLGWYSDAGLRKKVVSIDKGAVGNKTYYAKWKKTQYTINYVLNCDTATLNTEKAGYIISYNGLYENGYLLATATRNDDPWIVFGGWCSDKACKKYVGYFINDPGSDLTLYAKWVQGNYSIRFNKNNEMATGYMPIMAGLQGSSDTEKKYNLSKCAYDNVAYEFVGWSLTEVPGAGDVIFPDNAEVSNLVLNVNPNTPVVDLYAQWELKTFTIKYMDGDTELADMTPVNYNYFSENITTLPAEDSGDFPMTRPTRADDYTFAGWYKDAALTLPAGQPEIPSHSYGDLILYAKWNIKVPGLPEDLSTYIDVTDAKYGAVPDDDEDDSSAINSALLAAYYSSTKKTVYVPAGVYDITAHDRHSIKMYSHVNLLLDDAAVLNVSNKSDTITKNGDIGMIGCNDVDDVIIAGGTIRGGKGMKFHQEAITDILLLGSRNITIANMKICDSWGDGIYLGYTNYKKCENVTILNCEICDNRRNNITIVYADYTTVDNCYIHDANGAQPQAGICIEPNPYRDAPGASEYRHPCDTIYIKDTTITTANRAAWWYRTFYTYDNSGGSAKLA
ncbi:MAG: InlB B-repeat-containing protein, partial [Butyrivibrio sp.]|nr:InlB B-repeat-containing protein [Butyrivibrio sp.]